MVAVVSGVQLLTCPGLEMRQVNPLPSCCLNFLQVLTYEKKLAIRGLIIKVVSACLHCSATQYLINPLITIVSISAEKRNEEYTQNCKARE